ncbi:MAG: SUMF1/EgtB/PvdO family nonheme iron enzyme, partial [Sedimentisphaerales bacterium]|nr:SUMF1/EgtB/PvdO family nonheme iron enzyme [Sedimentisphaerales bacterium]
MYNRIPVWSSSVVTLVVCNLMGIYTACPAAESTQMVLVPAQTFMMGDNSAMGRADQRPVHPVTLSAYYCSPYMVTSQNYCDFLNDTSCAYEKAGFLVIKGKEISTGRDQGEVLLNFAYSPLIMQDGKFVPKPQCGQQPIYQVTWEGAVLYCNWLSVKEHRTPCYYPEKNWTYDFEADGYHLPTEAQWECAARAGHAGRIYPWGDAITPKNTNYDNRLGHITAVGTYPPNGYGLYDLPGNVMEWCNDWYKYDYYADCTSGVQNPTGPFRPNFNGGGMPVRVIRGGAYYHPAPFLTCAYRYGTADTKGCFSFNGFRVVRQASAQNAEATKTIHGRTQGSPAEMRMAADWVGRVWGQSPNWSPSAANLPFSFTLDGKPSSKLLKRWKITAEDVNSPQGTKRRIIYARDPKTGIEIACEVKLFDTFPAADWVLRITNRGDKDTPILEDVCVLDHVFNRDTAEKREFILRHSRGSRADEFDFVVTDDLLGPNAQYVLGGHGGRSSDYDLPFMNVSWGKGGAVMAVGWSGQWRTTFNRDAQHGLNVKTGMQYMRLKLHPGESIRTPRMLVMFWDGENMLRGHNLFRQLIAAHYNPRINGQLVVPPFAASVGPYTENRQVTAVPELAKRGIEVLWMDAGWFTGGWPFGAGNWVPDPNLLPNGLGPVGDAVQAAGIKFLLWFEIERVSRGSRLDREHPEWVIGPVTEYGGVLNWGIPEARRWITDAVSHQITAGKV